MIPKALVSSVRLYLFLLISVSFICGFIYLSSSGYGQQQSVTFQNFVSNKGNFSIDYPGSWIVREKNRFDDPSEHDLRIYQGEKGDNPEYSYPKWKVNFEKSNTNVSRETELQFGSTSELLSQFTIKVIEPVSLTKYKVGGEQTGSYVIGYRGKDTGLNVGEQVLVTKHSGSLYVFSFQAYGEEFDSPELTNIREHMINSIKWTR